MGLNFYFGEQGCDIRDTRNVTGRCPPFTLEVAESDGRVWVRVGYEGEPSDNLRQCGLSPEQAKRLVQALREAIRAAERE